MSMFNSFVGTFGLLLLFTAGVTSWVFRTSTAPIAAKLAIPACLVLLACMTPWRVMALMGYPTPNDPPAKAELLRFVAHDDDKMVYLWLREGNQPPRAYDIPLDAATKQALKNARDMQGHGQRVGLKKGKPGKRRGYFDFDTPPAPYEIDPDIFRLPEKNQ